MSRSHIPPGRGFCRRECIQRPQSLLAGLLFFLAPGLVGAQSPSLEEIRTGYERSLSRLDHFYVIFRTADHPEEPDRRIYLYRWAMSGRRAMIQSEVVSGAEGPEEYYACDGKRVEFITWGGVDGGKYGMSQPLEPGAGGEPAKKIRNGTANGAAVHRTFLSCLGVYFTYGGHSLQFENLASLLSQGGKVIGQEQVWGAPCWHVQFSPVRAAGDRGAVEVNAWFDPAAGWWPRRITTHGDGSSHAPRSKEIREFQRVETADGPYWFPAEWWDVYAMNLEEVTFGKPLPGELFRIDFPESLPVFHSRDEFRAAQAKQAELRTPEQSNVAPNVVKSQPGSYSNQSGRPPDPNRSYWIIGLIAGIATTIGAWKLLNLRGM